MSTTFTIDAATSRATPVSAPMKRLTVPAIRARKAAIAAGTGAPLVMLTAYTVRMAQLMDAHCDMLLVGDSLGQVIYGLPSTVPVTLEMMAAHGAAVVRGSHHATVVVDMPFGSYEASPAQAFENAALLMKQTGAAALKLEGGTAMASTIAFLVERGIPIVGHIGLTPQAVNALGGYGARGRSADEAQKIVADAHAVAGAGAFALVIEGVVEPVAAAITDAVAIPTIGIGASARCDGQVLVAEDMLGLFERTPRFVKRYGDMAAFVAERAERFAGEVRDRSFPGAEQLYAPRD
ncbi:3-methyl-2-oxobutanoate hydroxymethyltransferase [Sphingomonas sp. Leaf231]|uniref:3-methyl-2-oxobutanoate hydroxymethyltransferase n=1 Tax=Sphingomonas sp. Leaf231 TaxID=1736301 RepID=UPI0006F5D74D|nr:3-methyl-2-oxobutanoate hydroxymethyltransferase [Sphingomonas sp. Leaf231]KQN92875.1 3-methyl-2-oxobutanoate hydroxymethyltransferase [Sphingomonas sp. Leaf231]